MLVHHALPEAFSMAAGCGIWAQRHWKSNLGRRLFSLYTFCNVVIMILLMVAQFIALILLTENLNDFAAASYVFLAGFNGCVKGANFLWRKGRVSGLVDQLLEKQCMPQSLEEIRICAYYDRLARYTTLSYATLVGISSGATAIWPMFFSPVKHMLQLPAWYPYEVNTDLTYWPTATHQALGIVIGAAWNATNDTIIAGFMMQTCAQLELMSFRLQVLPEYCKAAAVRHVPKDEIRRLEERILRESVHHHLKIFRFANSIKSIFAPSIFIQFCLSIVILCITIYQLGVKTSNTIPVTFMLIFLSSMLVELFLYCWFGNEVTLKSSEFSESLCNADWTELHVSTLKGLLIMMLRTTSPIFLTCGPFITLSLNSYTAILKLSYSVFNVLQST